MGQIKIHVVHGLECPVCGCHESNGDGTVNIRGFKVGDNHGWWSQCLRAHGTQNVDGQDQEVGTLWFVDSQIANKTLIQFDGSPKLYVWENQS